MASFPAAATITTLLASAYWTACASRSAGSDVTMEMLMTWAWSWTAAMIPAARVAALPSPVEFACRTGRIVASGATPEKPNPGSCRPAMMPATNVP